MTTLAWGTTYTTGYILSLYPILFATTILIIRNVRFAYFLIIVVGICYAALLNRDIGNFLVFNTYNNTLYLVLVLPYLALLSLVPLTTSFLVAPAKHKKIVVIASAVIAIGFPVIAIAERYKMNYMSYAFIDAEINSQGQVKLNCKPGFADARTFTVTANSITLADKIKKYGEYYQGSYFLHTTIKKTFSFSNLESVTLTKIDSIQILPPVTWTRNEMKGDISFLKP